MKEGIAPYANLKGYVELEYTSSYDPLCATIVSVDTVHSVIFTYGFRPTSTVAMTQKATLGRQQISVQHGTAQRVDGVWWKHSPTVSGFVSLSNVTGQKVGAQLTITGPEGTPLGAYPVSLAPRTTQVIDLIELQSASASAGGAQLTYDAPGDSILINGGLEDIASGYSAAMSFRPYSPVASGSGSKVTTLTELGLMTGTPDPMMLFPQGTEFAPFSVIRNVSGDIVSLIPEIFWMDKEAMRRKALPALSIQASQTVMLDTKSLLAQAGLSDYNGMLNLTFKTKSSPGALLLAGGSVDRSGTYVFQVLPHEIRESEAKTINYWSTENGDDTMVTVWNPADEAQDFLFTLHYTSGDYVLALHLESRASRFFNIASIIHDQAPDIQGNIIPTTVTNGSARISGIRADNEHILVDLDAGTYNVRKATCSYYCISCDGAVNALIGEPIGFAAGSQQQLSFLVHESTGYNYDYAYEGNWSSDTPSVSTIDPQGLATGVSPGSFAAGGFVNTDLYNTYYCAYNVMCPDFGTVYASGGGSVYTLSCTSVARGSSTTCTATPGFTYSNWQFTDGTNTVTSASNTSNSWSGAAVQSGTVSVTVTDASGTATSLNAVLTVTPRTGYAFAAQPSKRQANGYTCKGGTTPLQVAATPTSGAIVGRSCETTNASYTAATVAGDGPSTGYTYITSATDTGDYAWIVASDIDTPASTFYQAQCGNYNVTTNSQGFISGPQLDADDQRHEGGTVNSHYAFYQAALLVPANNLGTVLEMFTAYGVSNPTTLQNLVNGKTDPAGTNVKNAASVEPCGNPVVTYDQTCTFNGFVNYGPTYAACH